MMAVARYLVHDVDAAVAFYTQHLGFTLVEQMGAAFARVSRDGLDLWLSGPQSSAARAMPDGQRPEPGGWNRIVVQVDNLSDHVAEMQQAGVRFRTPIISGPGGRQTLAEDGSGNVVELFEPA